jgi:small subunit ribosomal protein S17
MNRRETKHQRAVTGRVVSDRMDKTIAVETERRIKHPVYGKYLRRRTKLLVHDQDNQCKVGDRVIIRECRPLSRHKSWTLVQVEERATE